MKYGVKGALFVRFAGRTHALLSNFFEMKSDEVKVAPFHSEIVLCSALPKVSISANPESDTQSGGIVGYKDRKSVV